MSGILQGRLSGTKMLESGERNKHNSGSGLIPKTCKLIHSLKFVPLAPITKALIQH